MTATLSESVSEEMDKIVTLDKAVDEEHLEHKQMVR